ncbi:uncharacterized protein LOC107815926 [Nicotiana tabacum]|uniref:Uncharacterized protein n=3 Tax=Nicotiana TaxID=4085 RepID=A0A1S4C7E0_TOBAC|nr:PREDICTED: uncharacterized protein LOC104243262 [Nicotiana sylvestris]XP_009796726.1 PREDICTED: uncharacterized protein LOC104243262 [Nicotiana sylvestris]XP_016497063.1 PREDICTED: uncharacterized protein LOC107815926 [Nicotiana tabacum]XP_016497064.1 PREDICTED: uncharacterized protein LOC107815926 [Nicotiana tabacum]
MGKSVLSPNRIQDFARIISSSNNRIHGPTQVKPPASRIRSVPSAKSRAVVGGDSSERRLKLRTKNMEEASSNSNSNTSSSNQQRQRVPLADVVADCVKRWFQDTLKEAKAGDISMQVLVGQMYYSGYGISRDAQKGRAWINRASKSRSSAWKVSDKRPGYNASDSDSDDTVEDAK